MRVDGCGICGSDLTSYKVGLFTGTVPGHEVAGVIEAVGDGVTGWSAGDPRSSTRRSPAASATTAERRGVSLRDGADCRDRVRP